MQAQCSGSAWGGPDFTHCFHRKYIEIAIPLSSCILSFVIVLASGSVRFASHRQGERWCNLAAAQRENTNTSQSRPAEEACTRRRRPSQVLQRVDILEILLLFISVGINVASKLTRTSDRTVAITGISVWLYLLCLASQRPLARCWDAKLARQLRKCSILLYTVQWLLSAITLVLLLKTRGSGHRLCIASFAINSAIVLFTISVSPPQSQGEGLCEDRLASPEASASILSTATFHWVSKLLWKGNKKLLNLDDVWNVLPQDRASAVLREFRDTMSSTRLTWQLLHHFKGRLFVQMSWALAASLLSFAPALLLKPLLGSLENTNDESLFLPWLLTFGLAVSGILLGVANGQALWIGRRNSVQLRGILMNEIYRKALKISVASPTDMSNDGEPACPSSSSADTISSGDTAWWKFGQSSGSIPKQQKPEDRTGPSESSTGTMINLMAVDAFQVSELCALIHDMFPILPVQLIGATCLLYYLLGRSAIICFILLLVLIPLNVAFAGVLAEAFERIMKASDARIKLTSEILENIKVIKYLAWDQRFCSAVDEKRAREVKELRFRYLVHAFMLTALRILPLCIIGLSFFFYTAVEGNSLVPSIAFPALSLFNLLRVPLSRLAELTSQIQQCKTSMKRMDAFLRDSETEKYEQLGDPHSPKPDTSFIGFKSASFRWTSPDLDCSNSSSAFQLSDLDISFQTGMNLIVGSTGSGKTSLLLALLGEMYLLQGSVHLPGGYNRALLEPNPETGLTESVAYCAQESWLLNGTIKQNILFGSGWDEHRYQEVISHCALLADLDLLPDGDQTLVGEKGVMLSGGQKQRISLARAVYSTARYVLLDDCLSAVDSYTAEYLFQSLCGPIMSHRVVILVTNNESLCIPKSDYVVMISEGRVSAQGTPSDLSEKGIIEYTIPSPRSTNSFPDELKTGKIINDNSSTLVGDLSRSEQGEAKDSTIQLVSKSDIHTRIEKCARGAVSWRVAKLYLSAMGRWHLVTLMLIGLTLENIAQMLVNNWIRTWSDAYTHTSNIGHGVGFISKMSVVQNFVFQSYSAVPLLFADTSISVADGREVDDLWYASVYAGFVALTTVVGFVSIGSMFVGSIHASQSLHSRLIQSVLGAKFKFIDKTPMGQLMNRFSKDIQTIDQLVIHGIVGLVIRSGSILCIIFLITLIIPTFLLPAVLLSVFYGIVGLLYLRTSRGLKRLEAVQRSPIHQQFGETLRGVVTIRAFGEEGRFIRDNETNIDAHSSPFLCLWACTRWVSFRFDMAGSLVAFSAAALILSNLNNVDAGAAGLSLTYALGFNTAVQLFVYAYADCEQNMTHVERVADLLEVEQENFSEKTEQPLSWPSNGEVRFENFSTRYREDLGFVLKDLNLTFVGGEKVAIVGRTGAGKSSMAMALIRGLEADKGRIFLDDVDISSVSIRTLRDNITIVPQDPTVFSGTLRSNLDPLELYTDQEILQVLRRVQLLDSTADFLDRYVHQRAIDTDSLSISVSSTAPDEYLEASTDILYAMSSHMSQGQRQLVCLARALLKDSRLLIMDEATASIDHHTDAKLQKTLRELENTTVVTIAHRLQTIVDYDKVLVLENGAAVEFDSPWKLLQDSDGVFRGMCEKTGYLEELVAEAEIAELRKTLIQF